MDRARYKLTVAYRGTNYHGWQHQFAAPTWKGPKPAPGEGIPTVQELLSKALGRVVEHPVDLVGSSRTDAGVHAKGQVAHFDTHRVEIPTEGIRRAVNHRLPRDIVVLRIEPASKYFNAIANATAKRYQYFIWNAPDRNAFFADMCWHRWQALDLDAMRAAAELLVGEHDFAGFAKPGHKRQTTVRTVLDCAVSGAGAKVVIGITGRGFLWNMVRIMVGTLVDVGVGRTKPAEMTEMLRSCDRRRAGPTAPPHGLFLQWVKTSDDGTASAGDDDVEED